VKTIIGVGFKDRERERLSMEDEEEGEEREKNLKDSKKQRRENVGKGWMIMNGELKGYQKVVWTYIEESVIDSILREERIWDI